MGTGKMGALCRHDLRKEDLNLITAAASLNSEILLIHPANFQSITFSSFKEFQEISALSHNLKEASERANQIDLLLV